MLQPEVEVEARGAMHLHAKAASVRQRVPVGMLGGGTPAGVAARLRCLGEVALAAILLKGLGHGPSVRIGPVFRRRRSGAVWAVETGRKLVELQVVGVAFLAPHSAPESGRPASDLKASTHHPEHCK